MFGGKAAQLARALRADLPVPPGFALDWAAVRAVVDGDLAVRDELAALPGGPWAVRSSAIGEDSASASFAGTHLSVLGIPDATGLAEAVGRVHESASADGAVEYRRQHGLDPAPRMAVVVQEMVGADAAGVMFTRNPVTGVAERVVEASWGLGESVVSGEVSPDQYRLDETCGAVLGRWCGEKDVALRLRADGRVESEAVPGALVDAWCLDDDQLLALHRLAQRCDRAYGSTEHDIEFAFAGGLLHLLQRRPITHG